MMKKIIVLIVLLISISAYADWSKKYKMDPYLIFEEVYDVEYNIC